MSKLKHAVMFTGLPALVLGMAAVPASAAKPINPPASTPSCASSLANSNAVACSGYYAGNVFGSSKDKILAQQAGVEALPGTFAFDGNWSAVEPFKIHALTNINQLNFGTELFGETIIGAHFGNIAGPAKNVSVFWLFDFGTTGANYITLGNTQGFSNAVLYRTGTPTPTPTAAVPEPATWATMLMGLALIGGVMRSAKRRQKSAVAYA